MTTADSWLATPIHDEPDLGVGGISSGSGRENLTNSAIHALSEDQPLLGNNGCAPLRSSGWTTDSRRSIQFQIDPWAFRPPEARGSLGATPTTPERRSRRSSSRRGSSRPSTSPTSTVRMHGGGLVEAGNLPRPRQHGPDVLFQPGGKIRYQQTGISYAGEYSDRPGGSPDGSHRVAESFRGSPQRLAPVPDMREWRNSVLTGLVADEQGVRDLASPEPPELGTLPRLYQIQERIKYYMCELIKDPSGRTLRELYAEKLGEAGRDVRDKESLQFDELAKLLAMNELAPMYKQGQHIGDQPRPPYPSDLQLMHRDREKAMLKERESLDAIRAAETKGNLEAANEMRARLEEEKQVAAAADAAGEQAEEAPEERPAATEAEPVKSFSDMFSRSNLIKLLSASKDEAVKNTTEVVHIFAQIHELLGLMLEDVEGFSAMASGLQARLEEDADAAAQESDRALLQALQSVATGVRDAAQAFAEANMRRAVRAGLGESDSASAGSDRIGNMWDLLQDVGEKADAANHTAGVALAAKTVERLASLDQRKILILSRFVARKCR